MNKWLDVQNSEAGVKELSFMLARTLCVLKVMPPQRSDLVLTADVPHCKADVLVFNRLDVETCKRKAKQQLSIDCDTCVKEQFE